MIEINRYRLDIIAIVIVAMIYSHSWGLFLVPLFALIHRSFIQYSELTIQKRRNIKILYWVLRFLSISLLLPFVIEFNIQTLFVLVLVLTPLIILESKAIYNIDYGPEKYGNWFTYLLYLMLHVVVITVGYYALYVLTLTIMAFMTTIITGAIILVS